MFDSCEFTISVSGGNGPPILLSILPLCGSLQRPKGPRLIVVDVSDSESEANEVWDDNGLWELSLFERRGFCGCFCWLINGCCWF